MAVTSDGVELVARYLAGSVPGPGISNMPSSKELGPFSKGWELGGKPSWDPSSSLAKAASPTAKDDGAGISNEVVRPFPSLSPAPFTLTWLVNSMSSSVASGMLTMTIGLVSRGGAEVTGVSIIPTVIGSVTEAPGTSTII